MKTREPESAVGETAPVGATAGEPARSRKPDRRRARTRATITAAAAELFARHGVHGTTVEEIAQAAGTSAGTVYFHFGGKDGVAAATVHEALDVAEAQLLETRDRPTALGRLFAGFEVYLRFAVEQPLAFQLLSQDAGLGGGTDEAGTERRDAAARVQTFLTRARADLQAAVDGGELPDAPPPETITLIWATCSGLAGLVARTDGLRLDPEAAERTLDLARQTLVDGLSAAAPAPGARR